MILIVIGGLVVVLLIIVWVIYNSFVKAKNITEEAFSGIDVQLKKRFELIPNLIEAVKGYNAHEAEVLQKIVSLRGNNNKSVAETASSDQSITSALKHFRIQVENYPDLKANTQFLSLMDNLSKVENELAMSRRYFNGTIRDYNTKIEKFPAVLIAKPLGFNEEEFYSIEDDNERIAPEVNLNN
jgi:LemA protein